MSANCHVLAQVTTTDGVQGFGYVVALQQTFVTAVSEATLRNIELGVLVNYEPLVARLSAYFDGLIAGVTCLNIRCIEGCRLYCAAGAGANTDDINDIAHGKFLSLNSRWLKRKGPRSRTASALVSIRLAKGTWSRCGRIR